jgi:hypothetical protein
MSQAKRTLILWVLLICVFVAIWRFLTPAHPGPPAPPTPPETWLAWGLGGAALLGAGLALRGVFTAAGAHNDAFRASNAHVQAGRWAEAEAEAEPVGRSRLPQFRRAYLVHRIWIAARRLDRAEALARADLALAAPPARVLRGWDRSMREAAHALRAFLRASAGDAAGARADLDALAGPGVNLTVRARAALAEAILHERAGDHAALAACLDRNRAALAEATDPRDRALGRAFRALLESSAASPYRQPADATDRAAAEALAAWAACYAPSAAPFVRALPPPLPAASGQSLSAEAPTAAARARLAGLRAQVVRRKTHWPTLAGSGAGGVVITLGYWLAGADPLRHWVPGVLGLLGWLALVFGPRARAVNRRLDAAQAAVARGDLEAARAELRLAPESPESPERRAKVAYQWADLARREAEWAEVVARCDEAFLALAEQSQDHKVPPPPPAPAGKAPRWDLQRQLSSLRAPALAALGRTDDAWAEVAWASGFPTGEPVFWVHVLAHLAARDWAGARAAVAARAADTPLAGRAEVLARMVDFVGQPGPTAADAAQLRAELRWDPGLAAWIERAAPGLEGAFARAADEAVR